MDIIAKKMRNKKLNKFNLYYQGENTQELAIYISKNWKEYKKWSQKKGGVR